MRTPNAACILCAKPLYRRPYELKKVRYFACMACRSKAQSVVGVTDAQRAGLSLGSIKGTNHRAGYKHREESKLQVSAANKRFWAANPEKALARGIQNRGAGAYNWKGGVSRLNVSIRQMNESRKWIDAVKVRDGACVKCGGVEDLESHHVVELAAIVERLGIRNRDDAREHAAQLWDIANGLTLCRPCHWAHHGRVSREAA